ncbi:MAG: hypothetical protein IKL97_04050 [Eggerthellaceae bacterium]|nr:hypothetical protein [Eggerthellaceae bacterium]
MNGFHPCHPQCGKCRPPKPPMRVCEACGWLNSADPKDTVCEKCQAPLPEVKKPTPIHCLQIDQKCMNPCGRGKVKPHYMFPGKTCIHHTPEEPLQEGSSE